MYHILVSFEWNRMVDKKWHCILSAYSQFVITCWDFNDNYIWKFSLLLYLRIVHIYIMLNKKFNLFYLSLSYPITYSIYLFRYFHSLFFLEWVYQMVCITSSFVKIRHIRTYEKISGSRDFRIVLDVSYSVITNLLDLNWSCLNDSDNRYQTI